MLSSHGDPGARKALYKPDCVSRVIKAKGSEHVESKLTVSRSQSFADQIKAGGGHRALSNIVV